ncbi:unnamed protein product, partial [Ectocarpus sp. 12 AP-2014]
DEGPLQCTLAPVCNTMGIFRHQPCHPVLCTLIRWNSSQTISEAPVT